MSRSRCSLSRRHVLSTGALALAGLSLPGWAWARPDLSRSIEPTIAKLGHPDYRFEQFTRRKGDGRYRIWLAIPKGTPPEEGFPIVYALDGNGALDDTTPALLSALARAYPPIIVYLGYDTDKRFDVRQRHRDYTPARPGESMVDRDGRPAGGATAFLNQVLDHWRPKLERTLPVNVNDRTFWGHSFGGLCVLNAFLTRPETMTSFVAASPSLGWGGALLPDMARQWQRPTTASPSLWLLKGGKEHTKTPPEAASDSETMDIFELKKTLSERAPDIAIKTTLLPDYGHGQMFTASLRMALARVAGLDPTPWGTLEPA
ncbi:alpha/beta hydrolase [Larsenimonas salina]|uniref:alpha/beta hydrolase n=1 Tax=Larsenimonas salina TaxID=1295565 RepID=UPI002073043B|nr:alpha/beta hydrolase-fold protein [Larsenimonas salina]MCM5705409.1 alpha/beta hydrolase-fold protein [Larsenimonas salina]